MDGAHEEILESADLAHTTTRIRVEGLRLWGRHGVLEAEQREPQAFEVDVDLALADTAAEDELAHSVDYRRVIDAVHAINRDRRFRLIETFAREIARTLLADHPLVREAVVRVRKQPAFPVGIHLSHVCAEVQARRSAGPSPTSA